MSPTSRRPRGFSPQRFSVQILALLSGLLGLLGVQTAHPKTLKPSSSKLFPVPDVIRPNVEFWKEIYARRSIHEVLIHDADDLSLVYEVVDLRRLFPSGEESDAAKWRKVEEIKKGYRHILLSLARKKDKGIETLTAKESQVLQLFGPDPSARRLRTAARNVRAQRGLYEQFRDGLVRSGLYLDFIERVLEEEGLPAELSALPHVESSFNYKAYSKFGAAGIWQFIRSTGRMFLKINYEVDERFDPIRATEAAAKLLRLNYQSLGSWPLAITAYNHGLQGMKRAVRRLGTRDFGVIYRRYRSRTFGFASRNFYPEFLAALEIMQNYQAYFGDLHFHRPARFATIELQRRLPIRTLLEAFEVDHEEFAELNPALRRPVLQGRRRLPRHYPIRVPWRAGQDVQVILASLMMTQKEAPELVEGEYYRIRHGDSLTEIARLFGVPVSALLDINEIEDENLIHAGQLLRIPTRPKTATLAENTTAPPRNPIPKIEPAPERRTPDFTSSGPSGDDTLMAPGRDTLLRTAVADFDRVLATETAGSPPGEDAVPLEALVPPGAAPVVTASSIDRIVLLPTERPELTVDLPPVDRKRRTIRVEPEETLGHYADWLEVPTQRLRNLNRLAYGQSLKVGQQIKLTFENVPPEVFERRRANYHRGVQEDFFANFRIDGVQTHTVGKGETIWVLTNRIYQVPYWLVKKFNPERELHQLKPGDQLLIPLVGVLSGEPYTQDADVAN